MTDLEKLQDLKNIVDLTNQYLKDFTELLNPMNYPFEEDYFINVAISVPAMLASGVMDRVIKAFDLERNEVFNKYIDKVSIAMNIVDDNKRKIH